jgi:hypothetical protein
MTEKSEEGKNADFGVTGRNQIKPRCHSVSRTASGRIRYPFAAMLVNDFFVLSGQDKAAKARNALATFKSKNAGKQFTVYQYKPGMWVCRRLT